MARWTSWWKVKNRHFVSESTGCMKFWWRVLYKGFYMVSGLGMCTAFSSSGCWFGFVFSILFSNLSTSTQCIKNNDISIMRTKIYRRTQRWVNFCLDFMSVIWWNTFIHFVIFRIMYMTLILLQVLFSKWSFSRWNDVLFFCTVENLNSLFQKCLTWTILYSFKWNVFLEFLQIVTRYRSGFISLVCSFFSLSFFLRLFLLFLFYSFFSFLGVLELVQLFRSYMVGIGTTSH